MNAHAPFTAELLSFDSVANDTGKFRFRIIDRQIDTFVPGQFFLLEVEEKVHRAYSIATSPTELPEFELLIKYLKGGAASELLWKMKSGDTAQFRGPMGKFAIKHPDKKQLLIATGTGLAPIRSIYRSLLDHDALPALHLIFGVRHEDNLFCVEEFQDLRSRFPERFRFQLCLSQPQNDLADCFAGRVTQFVESLSDDEFADTEVSICGSRQMVVDIREILEQRGVDNSMVNVESW